MQCAISGEPPQHPVLSPSGHIYEKSLIQAYIAENGSDPTTGQDLTVDDLIDIKSSNIPRARPPSATSIPSLLSSFQSEWDALMLETFSLRKQLLETRQELSSALYQHDAAVRVIARLTNERDEARQSLAQLSASLGTSDGMSVDSTNNGISAPINGQETHVTLPYASDIAKKKTELVAARKRGDFKVDNSVWATAQDIENMKETTKTNQLFSSVSHITTLDVDAEQFLILTGGGRNSAGIFDPKDQSVAESFTTEGQVTSVIGAPGGEFFAVGLKTGSVQIFKKTDGSYSLDRTFKVHSAASTQLGILPYNNVIASAGKDGSWSLIDVSEDSDAAIIEFASGSSGLNCLAVHPDGGLIALGTADGQILVYALTEKQIREPAAIFSSSGEIKALSFSSNGRWLASSSSSEGTVSIWNLQTADLLTTITLNKLAGSSIKNISFDKSSNFLLAVSSKGLEISSYTKATKTWSFAQFLTAANAVDAVFGPNAKSVIAVNTKGNFYIYAV